MCRLTSVDSEQKPVADSCERGDEPLGSIHGEDYSQWNFPSPQGVPERAQTCLCHVTLRLRVETGFDVRTCRAAVMQPDE
jgi:hypothetical protein